MKSLVIRYGTFISLLLLSCSPGGLEPVAGIQGDILFHNTWPDSLKGVFLVALDEGVATDPDHPEKYIITYSGAILSGTEIEPYFIQLEPGAYYMGLLGILADPAFFITKLDSFLTAPEIPINRVTDPFEGIIIPDRQTIREKDWEITFTGDSP